MTNPWASEQKISIDTATTLITEQFPEISLRQIKLLGEGWDNVVYLVNNLIVFRFPRRSLAVDLLKVELELLPLISQESIPIPVPAPLYFGKPGSTYPWPFAGYTFLSGETMCRANLSDIERRQLVTPVARFLSYLHSIDTSKWNAPLDTIGRTDLKKRMPQVNERLNYLKKWGIVEDISPWLELGTRLEKSQQVKKETFSLVHGDLYARHLLIDKNRTCCGVIDWGDIHVGNRAIDLAVVFLLFPPDSRKDFWNIYGTVDKACRDLAQARALYSAVTIAWYGNETGDVALSREGRIAMDFLVRD